MKPTLCIPLRTGTKIAAVIDTIWSIFAIGVSIGLVVLFERNEEELLYETLQNPPDYVLEYINLRNLGSVSIRVFLAFNTFYWFQKVGLSILLYIGIVQRNARLVRVWMVYTISLLVLSVLFFLASICFQFVELRAVPIYVGAFVIREYSFWIVNSFVQQLDGPGLKTKLKNQVLHDNYDILDIDMTLNKKGSIILL